MTTDPGQVPVFWVFIKHHNLCLGIPFGRCREQKTQVLLDVQCIQTRAMPSLLSMQQVRVKHGPSLPMDQQLCGILEQEILHVAPHLCSHNYLLRGCNYGL